MNQLVTEKKYFKIAQFGVGLELILAILLFVLFLLGGFTASQISETIFRLLLPKCFYLTLFLVLLINHPSLSSSLTRPSSDVINLRLGIALHFTITAFLLVLYGIGGIIRFEYFILTLSLAEALFVVFITLYTPSIFMSNKLNDDPESWAILSQNDTGNETAPLDTMPAGDQATYYLKMGRTDRALHILEYFFLQQEREQEYQSVLLLSGELTTLEREILRGQMTALDARTQVNRIRSVALTLIRSI
jgi:hypothetical protein